jgi:hypothetical protein
MRSAAAMIAVLSLAGCNGFVAVNPDYLVLRAAVIPAVIPMALTYGEFWLFGERESFSLGAVEDRVAAGLVFDASWVVAMRTDTNKSVGNLATDVLKAAPPLQRGKKKPFPVGDG